MEFVTLIKTKCNTFIILALTFCSPIFSNQSFLDSLHGSFEVPECCSSTLSKCVIEKPHCTIAPRLVGFTTWIKELGRSTDEKIGEALAERYETFTSEQNFDIEQKGWPLAGDKDALVTITEYYSANCPMCKHTYRELFNAVTSGPLKGKANLLAKPFTLGIGDKALSAAAQLGRFSDFMLSLAHRSGRPNETMIFSIADSLGLNRKRFNRLLSDAALHRKIQESVQEAKNLEVTVTPTFFIGGKRYRSYKDPRWVIDAAEFIYDKK